MTKPTIKIHNVETGEIIERDLTAEEIKQSIADEESSKKRQESFAAAEAEKVTAQAKLAALGLTADDLKALGL
jgi:dihydroxyacid dehydratase/phosphogluconate dehydratase